MKNDNYKILTAYGFTGREDLIVPVEVVSFLEIQFDNDFLQNEKLHKSFAPKQCHSNAWNISLEYPNIEYVSGEVISSIPFNHSWNCYKGQYFDVTWELFLEDYRPEYYEVVRGSVFALVAKGYEFDHSSDIFTQWLNRPEIRENYPNSPFFRSRENT